MSYIRDISKSFQTGLSTYKYTSLTTADISIQSPDFVNCSTTEASFNVTLPAEPEENDIVAIFDVAESFGTNSLMVLRNGKKIMNLEEDLEINIDNTLVELKYSNGDWRIL